MKKLLFIIVFLCLITYVNAEIIEFGKGYVVAYLMDEKPLTIQLHGVSYHIVKSDSEWIINGQILKSINIEGGVRLQNGALFSYLGRKGNLLKIRIDAPKPCGNGVCESHESCFSCELDCGQCCVDSDGNDIYIKGVVKIGGNVFVDVCEGEQLVEFTCNGGRPKGELISCGGDEICDEGVCAKRQASLITGEAVADIDTDDHGFWNLFLSGIMKSFGIYDSV